MSGGGGGGGGGVSSSSSSTSLPAVDTLALSRVGGARLGADSVAPAAVAEAKPEL
jgi:hypothetical protein